MGKIVSELLAKHGLNQADLARKLGWKEPAVTKLLKKRNWNMFELQEVGKAINENLFTFCYPAAAEPMLPASQVKEALARIQKLEDKIKKMEIDYSLLEAKHEGALEGIAQMKK